MSQTFKGDVTNNVVELNLQAGATNIGSSSYGLGGINNGEIRAVRNGDITQSSGFYDAGSSFAGNDMKGLVIGTSCTSIGFYSFGGCSGLTGSLVIPDSVTSIGSKAFGQCAGLTGDLVIPNSVASIGSYAFYLCDNLTGLVIPNSVTTIGSYAFGECSSLTTAYLATPFANIPTGGFGSGAFYFSGLTTVYAKDAVASGWTLGAGQTVGGKTGVTVIDWTNYPNIP